MSSAVSMPRTAMKPRRPQASSDPLSIGRVMNRLMARAGYDREQGSAAVDAAWAEAAPVMIRGSSRPGSIRRGVLDVFVSHSAHVQELGFHKQAIISRLQQLLPDSGITSIRCRLQSEAGPTT